MTGHSPQIPITADERARIAELHAQGLGRNEIADTIGRSRSTVTNVAQAMGLAFDTSRTEVGVAKRAQDLRDRRLVLQARLVARAEHLMARLEAGTYQTVLRGEGGAEGAETLDFVPARDEKDLLWAVGTCLTIDERIEKGRAGASEEAATSMLTNLFRDVQGAWAAAQQDEATGEPAQP